MRAILYCRVSTSEQVEHGFSIRQQAAKLRDYCAERGIEVAEEVEDAGVSGTVLERPGLQRVIEAAADGGVDLMLAQDLDRVSREPWHFGYLKAKLEEYGTRLATLDDAGDGSPESEFFSTIRQGMAKMERDITRRRTQRGREQRAREGKVVGAASAPLGFVFDGGRDTLLSDPETAPLVRRVFRLVAEGSSINAVVKTFEREGIPTPRGGRYWPGPVIRDLLRSDLYHPHDRAELDALVSRGVLTREIADRAPDPCGVWWYGRDKTVRTGKLTESGGPARRFESRDPDEMVAVPVADAGVPPEHVERARARIRDNKVPSKSGRRLWTLSGGLARCACGRYLAAFHNGKKGGSYYMCGHRRRHGAGACDEAKLLNANRLEGRVRTFVERLLADPDTLREQVAEGLERERREVGPVEEEAAYLRGELESLTEERDGYLRQNARGVLSDADLDRFLAGVEGRRGELEEALGGLAGRRESAGEVERSLALLDEYLADLPYLLNLTVYEPLEEAASGNFEPPEPYLLTPETAPEPRPVDRDEMAARWRRIYEALGLRITTYRDETLVLTWAAGAGSRRTLAPGEPQGSGGAASLDPTLSLESDSQR